MEVFQHALQWLNDNENYVPDFVVQLRPTSPVRMKGLIDNCINKLLNNTEADSLRIITEAPATPYKMWIVENDEKPMKALLNAEGLKEAYNMPRQQLPKVYWQIGTLDVIRTKVITGMNSMSGEHILPHYIEPHFAVDIDHEESFNRVAAILKEHRECIQFSE